VYSLVSAPVLGFDLARRPGGARTARLLAAGLTLTAADLPTLATAHEGSDEDGRDEARLVLSATELARPGLGSLVAAALQDGTPPACVPLTGRAPRLETLETAPIGSLDALLRCVRHDVLDWTWARPAAHDGQPAVQKENAARAATVLCDAVAATYLPDALTPRQRRCMTAPWFVASRRLGLRHRVGLDGVADPGLSLGPRDAAVRRLLERLRTLDAADRSSLLAAAGPSLRPPSDWAQAVHEASWAVHLSDRVRAAAAVQLLGVVALDAAGVPAAECAYGTWNVVSGALQATVVADLVGEQILSTLLHPVLSRLGLPSR
jgi:hypothetical protein